MRSIANTIIRTLLAVLLVLAVCMSIAQAQELTSDTFSVGMISVKTTYLNPLWALERDFQSLHSLMYESLIRLNDNYEPEPYIATEWMPSNDCKSWTFRLRDDVYFSDGTKLTAYDVAATVNEIIRLAKDETAENHGVYASLKYVVSSAQANDALTVVIKASRPYYGVIYAMNFPILKADEVQFEYPIGSGPYRAEAFSPANYLYLSYNDHWWGEEPQVKYINAFFAATNKDLTADYEYNRVDAIITRSVTTAQYRGGVSSVNIDYRTRQLETLLLNMNSYELEDVRVRQAIRYALDPDALSNNAYYGMTSRTDTPFPRGTWMYYDPSDADQEDYFVYNLEKAKRLLDEAGWIDTNEDGVRDMIREGKRVDLSLRLWVYEEAENSVRVETANQIRDQLSKAGITVRVYLVSFALAKERLQAGNFDLCLAAYQMDSVPDPGFLLYGPNTGNYGRYKTKEMNDLITSLRTCSNQYNYRQTLQLIQQLFAKDCPFICLYYRGGAVLTRKLYTSVRDIREPDVLKGIEKIGVE
ncbi:MAG: hypothetical protein IJJ80_00980 [Clostridia bacterium]|nr:hypothetical protein [Clostridia bacterium]